MENRLAASAGGGPSRQITELRCSKAVAETLAKSDFLLADNGTEGYATVWLQPSFSGSCRHGPLEPVHCSGA